MEIELIVFWKRRVLLGNIIGMTDTGKVTNQMGLYLCRITPGIQIQILVVGTCKRFQRVRKLFDGYGVGSFGIIY